MFYSGDGEAPTPNLTRRETVEELAAQPGKAGEEAPLSGTVQEDLGSARRTRP